jgi:hypothetical protein
MIATIETIPPALVQKSLLVWLGFALVDAVEELLNVDCGVVEGRFAVGLRALADATRFSLLGDEVEWSNDALWLILLA